MTRVTQTKLNNLGIEVLPHPPYSPNLSPPNFHFFKHLDNFKTNRQFQNHAAVEEAFKEFIESRDVDFYRKGINDLIHVGKSVFNHKDVILIKYVLQYLFC